MFEEEVLKILRYAGVSATADKLEIPQHDKFGDIAFPCFELAKQQKKNPVEIARDIIEKVEVRGIESILPKNSPIEKVEARGPYVNFFFNWNRISRVILKDAFAKKKIKSNGKRIMIEFSQPNTAHGLHIGHARATMLGYSLANIMKHVGYHVIKTNYYGDFGTQMAKSLVAYMKWGKNNKNPDFIWDLYIKFHQEAAKNIKLLEESQEVLNKLEKGDKKLTAEWKKLRKIVLDGIKKTYKRLGVSFDVEMFESQYYSFGKDVIKIALRKGIAQESEGAVVTNLEPYGLPNTVLLKSDGTTLYQTRDIGLAIKNFKEYKLDGRIYVVDARQSLHFKQVFKILELLGYKWSSGLHHLGFGFVTLPDGLMASRLGKVVRLDEFLDELEELAYKEVAKHNPKLSEKKKNNIAEKIGTGALIFALLKIEPDQNIIFKKEDLVQFEGDTGPYIQYAYTRCSSILKKANKWKNVFSVESLNEEEKRLVKLLSNFENVVTQSAKDLRPHYVCRYVYELANAFNNFYEKHRVINAETDETKNFRLTLVKAIQNVLGKCLELAGMQAVEKM